MHLRATTLVLSLLLTAAPPPAPEGETPRGVWPLAPTPRVVTGFSPPTADWGAGHRGVDLAGRPGQRVLSARDGTVSHAAPIAGRGVVVVRHPDGTRTTYEPVLASVDVGDVVTGGSQLGWLTTAASHCLPSACLHWGWRRDEAYLDPLLLVGRPDIRLLPLWERPQAPALPEPLHHPWERWLQARGWAWV